MGVDCCFHQLSCDHFYGNGRFLALHIDPDPVRDRVRSWRESDPESSWMQSFLSKLPASDRLKKIGGLPSRLLLILMTILLVSVPLNQSYNQLRSEVDRKQQENRLRNTATTIWQKNFAEFANGNPRSYISQLSFQERDRKLTAQLQVVTSKIYSEAEREKYKQMLSVKLLRPLDSIAINLIQIPTASSDLLRRVPSEIIPPPPPTVAQLQSNFASGIDSVLGSLLLPDPAQMVDYQSITSPTAPLKLQIGYLSDRQIDRDGLTLVIQDIRRQLDDPTAEVSFQRIVPIVETISFGLNQSELVPNQTKSLDKLGQTLQKHPKLQTEITTGQAPSETGEIAQARSLAVQNYLQTKWQIQPDRYVIRNEVEPKSIVRLKTIVAKLPNALVTDSLDRVDEKSNQ